MAKNGKKWQKMKNVENDKEKGNYEKNLGHKTLKNIQKLLLELE